MQNTIENGAVLSIVVRPRSGPVCCWCGQREELGFAFESLCFDLLKSNALTYGELSSRMLSAFQNFSELPPPVGE